MKFGSSAMTAYAAHGCQTVELRTVSGGRRRSESWALDLDGLTPTTLSNMVCVGKGAPIGGGDTAGVIEDIYVSPSGQVLLTEVCSGVQDVQDLLSSRSEDISRWTADDLDDIAYRYFYAEDGQASLVIDAMCRCGLCSYSESERLARSIDACFSSRSFIYLLFVQA